MVIIIHAAYKAMDVASKKELEVVTEYMVSPAVPTARRTSLAAFNPEVTFLRRERDFTRNCMGIVRFKGSSLSVDGFRSALIIIEVQRSFELEGVTICTIPSSYRESILKVSLMTEILGS